MNDKVTGAYRQSKGIYDDVLTQSKWWSRLYIQAFWGVDDTKIAEKLFAMLPEHFAGSLLDVPCGTMNLTAELYGKLKTADITCLDYSADMLAGARERTERQALSNVTIMQGDVGHLPFGDATFDVVLSMNGFHVFPNKTKAYAETARVLKPGGHFLGCFYIKGEYPPSDFVVHAILARRGWFTPPFQTKADVLEVLQSLYSRVELYSDKAMAWFRCVK